MTKHQSESARSTLFSFAGIASIRGLAAFSQLLLISAASQLFDPADFGRFVIAYAFARLIQAFGGLGAQSYLLKDVPYRQTHGRGWHNVSGALTYFLAAPILICLCVAAVLELLAYWNVPFYPLILGEGAALSLLGLIWTLSQTLAAYVRVLRTSSEAMVLSELLVPTALVIAIAMGWWQGLAEVWQVLLMACAMLLIVELAMLFWHFVTRWMPIGGEGAEPVSLKEMTAYWGTVLLNTASGQLDIILAGTIISPALVGVYAIIKRVCNVMVVAASIVVWMYAPKISRASAASNQAALAGFARRAMQLTLAPATLIAIALIAGLPWWTAYFELELNQTFWAVFAILLGAQMISTLMGSTMMFATQTGRPMLMVKALSRALAIVVPAIFILGLTLGIAGVAIAQALMILLMKWPVRRRLLVDQGLDVSVTTLFRSGAASSSATGKK